jgi:hypothetical protein
MRSDLLKFSLPLFAVLLLAIHSAHAGFRPSFRLDFCAWHATHIVLVATTPTDDVFAVTESWKGDLKPGDTLEVLALKPESAAVPISLYPDVKPPGHSDEYGVSGRIPRQPIGSQMILFLKRRHGPVTFTQGTSTRGASEWQAVSSEMKVSVVWIDGGQPYCFQQLMNPGPSTLSHCWQRTQQLNSPALRRRINEVLQTQDDLARVLDLEDRGARAEQLQLIVYRDVYEARKEALQGLGKAGSPALPAIRRIMDKPPIPYDSRDLIRALAEAAGEDAGKELNERLRQDLGYWRAIAGSLKEGWWNQDVKPEAPLRERYDETIELVRALDHERYRPAARTATELRDFWLSLPQLNDGTGLSQMAKESGQLVKHLNAK